MNKNFEEKLKKAQELNYNIGACVRVQYGDTFLLLKRSDTDIGSGIYENPGGSVDDGEELRVAATRELFEESGIVVSPEQLTPLDIFEFHNIETNKHKVKFAFSVILDHKPTITLSADHDDFAFLTKQEIEVLPRQGRDEHFVLWEDHYKVLLLK